MYKKSELNNGLRLIQVPMQSVESVSVQVLVRVGGRDETKEKMGLSHFVEHTIFKGTTKRPTMKAISQEVEQVGGFFNAFTSSEHTVFYIKAPKEKIEVAFDILSDSLYHSLFQKEPLEKEKKVIIEEINVYEDMPMAKVESVFNALLFPKHPLGFDLTGTKETVASLTREDVLAYMKKHYIAGNTVLAVAGNFEEKLVNKLTQKYFGQCVKGQTSEINQFKDTQNTPRLNVFNKQTDQSHLCLGFKVFAANHPDRFKLTVLNTILGGGASSRLFESIREKEGLCYYVNSEVDHLFDTGVWYVRAGVDNKRVLRAVKLIIKELMKIRNSRVTKKELHRAKEYLKGGIKISMESSDAQGSFYGTQELLKKEILSVEEICRRIDAVTTDELLELARKLIVNEKLNFAMVGPFANDKDFKKLIQLELKK